ncbi:hypothetical protein CYMTET_6761 [Cymbomonas tetramitiformis]|uniref:Uncharacterized protein n=1 Tax=Cymbomonas tetramitiformis TaxID=36881 RepID=A0AAE0GWT1_9CHLO|nr:hypothetical protein CYMTET_6761 [Cymbomonas tetramitiformis]
MPDLPTKISEKKGGELYLLIRRGGLVHACNVRLGISPLYSLEVGKSDGTSNNIPELVQANVHLMILQKMRGRDAEKEGCGEVEAMLKEMASLLGEDADINITVKLLMDLLE